jgi:hypothetical protein
VGKYSALARHLTGLRQASVRLTFEQVAELVPGGLPDSAYRHSAWWANETDGRHVQSRAWTGAGWQVETVDLAGRSAVFSRTDPVVR